MISKSDKGPGRPRPPRTKTPRSTPPPSSGENSSGWWPPCLVIVAVPGLIGLTFLLATGVVR